MLSLSQLSTPYQEYDSSTRVIFAKQIDSAGFVHGEVERLLQEPVWPFNHQVTRDPWQLQQQCKFGQRPALRLVPSEDTSRRLKDSQHHII